MTGVLYRQDLDEVRTRLRLWWHGEDIGRPVMKITAPGEKPVEMIDEMPRPAQWQTDYSTSDFDYRVFLARQACNQTYYIGEAVPWVSPDLGPGCLSLYLGCEAKEEKDTVWFEPFLEGTEEARFPYNPDNFYWCFTLQLTEAIQRIGRGKFLLHFPDLIEGLDTLAAMRGTEELLMDMISKPDWVHACLREITDRYFHYYDVLYDRIRDEQGGSCFWIWAPGRMSKLQCDFSAMIGPDMFRDFMGPVLREMTERLSYSMYHWDGPGALPHLDCLLELPQLDMIQWVPGAGAELPDDRRWWPLYHRMVEAGKRPFIHYCSGKESLLAMKKEFGEGFKRFYIEMQAPDKATGEEWLKTAEV